MDYSGRTRSVNVIQETLTLQETSPQNGYPHIKRN